MNRYIVCLVLLAMSARAADAPDWKLALPGWNYQFPADHRVHPEFQTEWWYFTGNLRDTKGGEWGYQLTFFRKGINRTEGKELSRFVVRDLKFAHFAVSDLSGKRFQFAQKTSRGAFGEAGFDGGEALAWLENWSLKFEGNSFVLKAQDKGISIDLTLQSAEPPVIHGANGVSQKADGVGRASHYYSLKRLLTVGSVSFGGKPVEVFGESWFDHEWATNQLAANQIGWDWFSMQFEDGSELMLYQMRCADGSSDANSSGTFFDANGTVVALKREDYRLTPLGRWKSPKTGGEYPLAWRVEIPKLQLLAETDTPLEKQELFLNPIAYWEGAIRVNGSRAGRAIRAKGYMELTGYTGALVGIQAK